MTEKERKLALHCLKASSDYHSEVCEECINYPNCDHTIQDDVTETIIKVLEQEPCEDAISRKAVLDTLDTADKFLDEDRTVERYKAMLTESYEVLSPVKTQEPCDDRVRRQAVLDILKDKWNKFSDANDAMQESIDTIEALKPVTPQPKMGQWIDTDNYYQRWKCSECGCHTRDAAPPFCPNCGAKMESEDKNG